MESLGQLEAVVATKDKQLRDSQCELAAESAKVSRLESTNEALKQQLYDVESKVGQCTRQESAAVESLKRELENKEQIIGKLKQEVTLMEGGTKQKQVAQIQREDALKMEVERLSSEIKRLREGDRDSYSKDLEIKHLTAQIKAKDLEVENMREKYRQLMLSQKDQVHAQEQDWNKAYQSLAIELQGLRGEIGAVRRENELLKDSALLSRARFYDSNVFPRDYHYPVEQ